MIEVNYNQKEDIIYVTRTHEVILQDLLNYVKQFDEDYKDFDRLHIVDDLRASISKYESKDYPLIIEEIKKRIGQYKEVRIAVLVMTPQDTALSLLYEQIAQSVENYNYKTFSTLEAGRNWLK